MRIKLSFLPVLLVFAAAAAGCGSKGNELKPKSPWEESFHEYFDDSIDYTINPQSLSGQWLFTYQKQLKGRLTYSEIVLGVNVVSITQKTNPEGRGCKDLYCDVKANVKGNYAKDSVTLTVCDDQAGFDSLSEDDSRLFDRVMIAFVKLYENADGTVAMHWHLSPLSKDLKDGMDKIFKDGKVDDGEEKYIFSTE
ncbi:MAG: hypothetical protein ABIJ56_03035 [Pseudomonadota bacterium]